MKNLKTEASCWMEPPVPMRARLNKRERRAAALLAHYATCERLAAYLSRTVWTPPRLPGYRCAACGQPASEHAPGAAGACPQQSSPDGKKISVALWKIERDAHNAATAQCNGEPYCGQPYREDEQWEEFKRSMAERVAMVFGRSPRPEHAPPGFFVNGDARGYALKIDPENQQGAALIAAVGLHKDWGGYGILSPEITG